MKQFLVYDRFTQSQWRRMSYEQQRLAVNRWRAEYSNNPKYWPQTAGECA
jgi:hypothetical protein